MSYRLVFVGAVDVKRVHRPIRAIRALYIISQPGGANVDEHRRDHLVRALR